MDKSRGDLSKGRCMRSENCIIARISRDEHVTVSKREILVIEIQI